MKASQRGSRESTAAELRRAREEWAEAEAGRRELRRELDAMVGRVAQLTAQLCNYSGGGRLCKRRRERYVSLREDVYERSRGLEEYEGERGLNGSSVAAVSIAPIMGDILTAATNATTFTNTMKMVPPTAFGGSHPWSSLTRSGRTRTGMAAVDLRLGAEMTRAVTGVLVSPLRLVVPSKPTP